MLQSAALNSILGSTLVVILILADYTLKHNTDYFQRTTFLYVLLTTLSTMAADFVFYELNGDPGTVVRAILHVDLFFYYIFQIASFYCVFVFVDYLTFKDRKRTKKIVKFAWIMVAFNGILLLLNLRLGFYYYLAADNVFCHGNIYFVRLIASYLPIAMVFIDLIFLAKSFKTSQTYLILLFIVLVTSLGALIDITLHTTGLIWPCYTSGLLYAYFFIIRSESKIDSLTGIGNRYSFNEFISQVSGPNAKQPYSIVMIDMDHFKEINDTLGHPEGDNALRDMAAIIKGCIRYSDFAARYGGDEFVLAAKKESDIVRLMERIQESINNQNNKNTRPYKIQISYGYDVFTPNSGQSIEAFLSRIDKLMYKQKAEKRRSTDNADP
jgi:diguanylate cyclase (GGDEF)-like protein